MEVDEIKSACKNLGINYTDFFNEEEKIEELQEKFPVIFKNENSLVELIFNIFSDFSEKLTKIQKTLNNLELNSGNDNKIEELTKSVNNFINSPLNSNSQPQQSKSFRKVPYIEKGVNPFNNREDSIELPVRSSQLKSLIGKKMEYELSKGIPGFYSKVATQLDAGYLEDEFKQELLKRDNILIVNN